MFVQTPKETLPTIRSSVDEASLTFLVEIVKQNLADIVLRLPEPDGKNEQPVSPFEIRKLISLLCEITASCSDEAQRIKGDSDLLGTTLGKSTFGKNSRRRRQRVGPSNEVFACALATRECYYYDDKHG